MPAHHNNSYIRPTLYFNAHLETIYPALFRKVKNPPPAIAERIDTPDGDFLDIFWHQQGKNKVVIIQHGLEGSADRPYVQGMAKCFFENGFDALTWNYRGCGPELNRTRRFYHSGATDDLDLVVQQAVPKYDEIYLVGFSLGGNLTLKYVGESVKDPKVKKAVAISAPLDLGPGVDKMHGPQGYIYEKRFINNLKNKVMRKHKIMPDQISTRDLMRVKTLRDFDDYYTAPLHGFDDAADYYKKCSSKRFLRGIAIPTLILNAANDPILSEESLDMTLVNGIDNVLMEITKYGGHVGYIDRKRKYYWSEERALQFCTQN